jgi:Cyclin, N-terminal domain
MKSSEQVKSPIHASSVTMTEAQPKEHNDTFDTLHVMLHQEKHIYHCPDYFAPDYRLNNVGTKQSSSTPLNVIEECAKLVTDPLFANIGKIEQELSSPNDVRSRTEQTKSSEPVALLNVSSEIHLIPSWRSQMCSWAYSVVDTFGFSRHTVAICFDILDRFLAKECLKEASLTRQDFQLVSMTALYLAVKVNESGERLCMETLIDMSRGYFSIEDFEVAEMDMVDSLQWRLSPPTANCFLLELRKQYHKDMSEEWISFCEDILEASVADAYCVPRKGSQLAVAAILLSGGKCGVPQEELDLFCDTIKNIVDVNDDEFKDILMHLSCP